MIICQLDKAWLCAWYKELLFTLEANVADVEKHRPEELDTQMRLSGCGHMSGGESGQKWAAPGAHGVDSLMPCPHATHAAAVHRTASGGNGQRQPHPASQSIRTHMDWAT